MIIISYSVAVIKKLAFLKWKKQKYLYIKRALFFKLTRFKTKHSKEFPCYLVTWWLFSFFVPKRRLSTSTFWHNYSPSQWKMKICLVYNWKDHSELREKAAEAWLSFQIFFFSGKMAIFNDVLSRGIQKEGVRFEKECWARSNLFVGIQNKLVHVLKTF